MQTESTIAIKAAPTPVTNHDTSETWEDRAYPKTMTETRTWMREQRGLIRAFLASPHGQRAGSPCLDQSPSADSERTTGAERNDTN